MQETNDLDLQFVIYRFRDISVYAWFVTASQVLRNDIPLSSDSLSSDNSSSLPLDCCLFVPIVTEVSGAANIVVNEKNHHATSALPGSLVFSSVIG